jgi:hypothetical protein
MNCPHIVLHKHIIENKILFLRLRLDYIACCAIDDFFLQPLFALIKWQQKLPGSAFLLQEVIHPA